MALSSGAQWRDNRARRVCIDNGAHTCRIGLASDLASSKLTQIFNAAGVLKKGRKVIGSKVLDEFEKGNSMVLEQPIARGMLYDPELQA